MLCDCTAKTYPNRGLFCACRYTWLRRLLVDLVSLVQEVEVDLETYAPACAM
jgi:hypothetical protein